jgi:hypothetical protein
VSLAANHCRFLLGDGTGGMATLSRKDRSHIATHPPPPEARNEAWRTWCNRRGDHLRVFP